MVYMLNLDVVKYKKLWTRVIDIVYNITYTNRQSYNGQVLELGSNGGQEAPVNHGGANNVMLTDRYRHDQSNNGSQNSITCI